MAAVELHQVTKQYPNGVLAVRDLNLTVAEGELVVLVGPSGCGKTTTLRLIAGLEEPTAGTVSIAGRVVNGLPPHRRDVAMVFQRPALYPHLNVRDNLAFGLRLRRPFLRRRISGDSEVVVSEKIVAERVTEAARMLDLEELLNRRPDQLSGGQQQRVALGRAVVRRPAVFLLDEPLAGLDPPLRNEMRRELHLLHRRLAITMIYVTHDQVEAMALGDRVIVLDRGVIQQADRPRVLYQRPRNRFVAGFIGWPSMSFIDGELIGRDGHLGFSAWGWWLPLLPEQERVLAPHAGRPVTLGIRPEHVRIAAPQAGPAISLEVVLVEPLGGGSLWTLRRGGWQLTALVGGPPTDQPPVGQTVEVSWDMRQAHWFDRSSGVCLGLGGPEG
jgi:multiple sugar transport system ATP-binding protein